MTNPMLAELDAVVRLMEAATEGEWGSWHLPASGTSGDAFGHLIGPPIRYRDRSQGFTPDDAHLIARSVNFLRTHHATLADMAKRLEAAERDAGKCWALHFKGPDDVVAAPSREAAEIAAHNFNAFWDAHKHLRAHDVRVVAEVVEWEHGAVEHAKSAAEHWPEYADLLNAAIDATQEGEG